MTPTGEICTNSSPAQVQSVQTQAQPNVTPVTVVTPTTSPATVPATPHGKAAAPANRGGVLGVHTVLAKAKSKHGVLGTVARVSGSTLPFTGFPLWSVLVVALGLIAAGAALRRRGPALQVE